MFVQIAVGLFAALLAVLPLAVLPLAVFAQSSIMADIAAEMSTYEDTSGEMSLEDILARGKVFTPLQGFAINPGYVSTAVWVRLTLLSPRDHAVLLSLSPNFVDLVNVYVGAEDGSGQVSRFAAMAMGDHRPLSGDPLSGLDDVVRLNLLAGVTTAVYVRLQGVNSAVSLSVDLYSPRDHTLRTTLTSLAFGSWFGGMATLIVVQLVFFSFDRRVVYLLVASSTFAAMLVYGGTAGLSRLLLFPQGGIGNDLFTALSVWIGQIATSLAAISVLELRAKSRLAHRAAQVSALFGVACTPAVLAGYHRIVMPYCSLVMFFSANIVLIESIRLSRDQQLDAKLKAETFFVLWLGLVLTLTQRVGVVKFPEWIGHSYALSNLLYTVLLTGAMALRLRAVEALNAAMQGQALIEAEAAHRRANRMVEERTRELADAKRVAEEALKAELASQQQQVRFMEVISHQYRMPLAGLRSNVESIGLSLPPTDTANHERLGRVRSSILRLVEVLEVNLSRSRLQGPAFRPERPPVSLGDLVRAAHARGQSLLDGADIVLDASPAAQMTEILADEEMLSVAIVNLLENGVKFSAQAHPAILLTYTLEGSRAIIQVIDHGIGIPQDELGKIFEHSFRASNARWVPGTGMGLSLASRIVRHHDGFLRIRSELGKGSTVEIDLPLVGTV